jgi:hypothetical protein
MSDDREARKPRLSIFLQGLSTRVSSAWGTASKRKSWNLANPFLSIGRTRRMLSAGADGGTPGLLPNPAAAADVSCEDHPECDFECYKCRDAWYRFMHSQPIELEAEAETSAKTQPG